MKKIIFLLFFVSIILIPNNVYAAIKCPDGYEVEGEECVKYSGTMKEFNTETCVQGTKVKKNGKNMCKITVAPIGAENTESNKPESESSDKKNTIDCDADKTKECVCEEGYELEDNWCVIYKEPWKEFNTWVCDGTGGTRVEISSNTYKCKVQVEPTIQEKKANVVTTTTANDGNFKFCEEDGVLKTFQIVGYLITLIKVLVPLILIIFGSIDFGKAVVASDDKAIQSAARMLVIRAVGGIIIFFIPTIIHFAVNLISSWSSVENEFKNCSDCMDNASTCESIRENLCTSDAERTCTWDSDLGSCSCVDK